MTAAPVLEVTGLRAGYGRMEVVSGVSFVVHAGEWVALAGRNGAGKTTTLSATVGLLAARRGGSVVAGGQQLHGRDPTAALQAGVTLVPAGRPRPPRSSLPSAS